MTSAIEDKFNALAWHDAALLQLTVDRRAPGECDQVVLVVEWPDGVRQQVEFVDCYLFESRMNFGVIAPESIRDARCSTNSSHVDEIRRCWAASGVTLGELYDFEFTTNSTSSELRICERAFRVRAETES